MGEAQPHQRLVIKEMVLENFKSYAGVQRIGPFHKARARRAALGSLACAPRRWAARAAQCMREAFTGTQSPPSAAVMLTAPAPAVLLLGGRPQRQRQEQRD